MGCSASCCTAAPDYTPSLTAKPSAGSECNAFDSPSQQGASATALSPVQKRSADSALRYVAERFDADQAPSVDGQGFYDDVRMMGETEKNEASVITGAVKDVLVGIVGHLAHSPTSE